MPSAPGTRSRTSTTPEQNFVACRQRSVCCDGARVWRCRSLRCCLIATRGSELRASLRQSTRQLTLFTLPACIQNRASDERGSRESAEYTPCHLRRRVTTRRPEMMSCRRPQCAASPVVPRQLRWDTLQVVLALLVLVQVWRIHDLLPGIAMPGLPVLSTLAVLFLLVLDQDTRRRLDRLNQPVVRAALALLLLATLSIPGSLYPRYSATLVVKDYMRSVALMTHHRRQCSRVGRSAAARLAPDPGRHPVLRSQLGARSGRLRRSTSCTRILQFERPGVVDRQHLATHPLRLAPADRSGGSSGAARRYVVRCDDVGTHRLEGGVLGVRGGGGLPVGGISRH